MNSERIEQDTTKLLVCGVKQPSTVCTQWALESVPTKKLPLIAFFAAHASHFASDCQQLSRIRSSEAAIIEIADVEEAMFVFCVSL